MASLADIRARLAAQDNKQNNNQENGPVYPHWNINEGDTAILRFLEDGNPDNPYFWVERAMFKFPFNGIKGDPTASNNVIVQVPCMEMYGEKDSVLDEVRTWFKDTSLEDMGRKYWKKRSYLFQGFVRQDPMAKEGDTPLENPIRRFMISPQIFGLIKSSLMDPEIENLPTNADGGLDFRITKTTKGGFSDYSTSLWARKETALTNEELAAIETHGLSNLADFLPAKPGDEELRVIREMFEASVEGEAYDPEKWGAYYTPAGMSRTGTNSTAGASTDAGETTTTENVAATTTAESTAAESTAAVVEDVVETAAVVNAPANDNANKAQDILAMIRSRQK
jgi:hypothetical protein